LALSAEDPLRAHFKRTGDPSVFGRRMLSSGRRKDAVRGYYTGEDENNVCHQCRSLMMQT
jgi:hypothetical protein